MPKRAKELTAIEVQRLREPGRYSVGVVPGLHLLVKSVDARSWVLRAMVGSERRDIGLGGYPAVTLAQAHRKAREFREAIDGGADPVQQRREAKSALRAEQAKDITFRDAADAYIKAHSPSWRNEKHRAQWKSTLESYAHPVIGDMLVKHIEMAHVLLVLSPIWVEKTETAVRLRGRIEQVLDWCKGRGHRTGDNPAAWRGNLDAQLARPQRVARSENQPALDPGHVGSFMERLRAADGMGARALEFAILTAARSGEARGAAWSEIDLDAAVWTVPAVRMKAGVEHRVPLCPAAVALLKALPRLAGNDLVFPAPRGGQLSDMTLTAVIRRINEADGGQWRDPRSGREVVPHGFRSTFRDWAAEHTNYPREVAEMALAHAIPNAVEAAYRRGDLFEKRRRLMSEWAQFLSRPLPTRAQGSLRLIASGL